MGHLADYLTTHPRTKGMSAAEFGRLVGIAKSSANEILTGRATPRDTTLVKMADAFPGMPLAELRDRVLMDTPFALPPAADLLNEKERKAVEVMVHQLLESSGKLEKFEAQWPDDQEQAREATGGNVFELPRPQRVQRAAYSPPDEE